MIYITKDICGVSKLTLDFYPAKLTIEFTGDPNNRLFKAYINDLYEDERIRVYGEFFQSTNLTIIFNNDTGHIEVYSNLISEFEIDLAYEFSKLDAGEPYQDCWIIKQRDMKEFFVSGNKLIKTGAGNIVKMEIFKNAE